MCYLNTCYIHVKIGSNCIRKTSCNASQAGVCRREDARELTYSISLLYLRGWTTILPRVYPRRLYPPLLVIASQDKRKWLGDFLDWQTLTSGHDKAGNSCTVYAVPPDGWNMHPVQFFQTKKFVVKIFHYYLVWGASNFLFATKKINY